ncbi:MAG: alpha/beta hydrolase [Anaerolineales bacterium]
MHFLDPCPDGRPTVLLLHGLGAGADSWTMQFPALMGRGYRPIAPDLPGFGSSPYDGRGWSIRREAEAMACLLEDLRTGPVAVVGLSMGGTIAQQIALDFPQLTRALVLVSTFSVMRPERLDGWLYFLRRFILVSALGLSAQARYVAGRIFPGPQNEELRALLIASIEKADPRAYRSAMRALGLFNSMRRLNEIQIPTLVVTGKNDTTVPPVSQRKLVEGIWGARQVVIGNAGHAVTIDQPEAFNQALLGFLEQI